MRPQMLPAELLGRPGARRSVRDWLVDVTLCLFALSVGAFVAGTTAEAHSPGLWVADAAGGCAALLAMWWRRRHPVRFAVVALAASAVSGLAAGAALVAIFNLAVRGTRRQIVWAVAGAMAASAVFPLIYPDPGSPFWLEIVLAVVFNVLCVGWGLFVRAQRELVQSLHQRAEQLEAEQRLREERAREAERLRIAGEMHDVLAHRISLLAVHAGALEFNPDPGHVAEAAGVIRATAPGGAGRAPRRDRRAPRRRPGRPAAADARRDPRTGGGVARRRDERDREHRRDGRRRHRRPHRLPRRAGGADQCPQARARRRRGRHGERGARAARPGRQPRRARPTPAWHGHRADRARRAGRAGRRRAAPRPGRARRLRAHRDLPWP